MENLFDKYFLQNIKRGEKGKRENAVDDWIGERKFAPIFYGENTLESIRAGKNIASNVSPNGFKQAVDFVSEFDDFSSRNKKILLSIGDEFVYFYKQKGKLRELGKDGGEFPKGFDIEFDSKFVSKIPICECPLVLSSIKSNNFLGRGTFHEIPQDKAGSYFGNIKAIDWIVSKEKQKVENFAQYLQCLSSLEFETLIAKIKEEQGFFVPAYKGGFLKDLDLICRKGGKTEELQIKLHLSKNEYDKYAGKKNLHFYCITKDKIDKGTVEKRKQKIFDKDDIEKDLQECAKAKEWLRENLHWVDFKF